MDLKNVNRKGNGNSMKPDGSPTMNDDYYRRHMNNYMEVKGMTQGQLDESLHKLRKSVSWQHEESMARLRDEMEERMRRELETVYSSVGKKVTNRSSHNIPKIHGLDSPRSTFDGTLQQFAAFARELRQWCDIYKIADEQALVIM